MLGNYLQRIGLSNQRRDPDLDWLTQLQTAHMIHVPFENLDVFGRHGVSTNVEQSLNKVVGRRKGGWCFEINGTFGWLLTQLGYDSTYVSCQVFNGDNWGPDLDHCGVVVLLNGRKWYVDVGFGDNCMVPIPLETGDHVGVPTAVRCRWESDRFVLSTRQLDGLWADQLRGSLHALPLTAFEPRSNFLQTEPGLSWTEKPFATRATRADGSRVTLRPGVLRTRTRNQEFSNLAIEDDDWTPLLAEHFGLS
jgi:N-hydroxyarylamine O-acetyltransferase